jgi:hypothetical protein
MNDSTDYAVSWEDYRRRCRRAALLLLGWLPVAGGFAFLMQRFHLSEAAAEVGAGAWMVAAFWTALRIKLWRCPRCGNRFFMRRLVSDPFARKCLHCGLPKWELRGSSAAG